MDVFPGWNGYVERLEANWRKLVKPEDTIVLAGDISWATVSYTHLDVYKRQVQCPRQRAGGEKEQARRQDGRDEGVCPHSRA